MVVMTELCRMVVMTELWGDLLWLSREGVCYEWAVKRFDVSEHEDSSCDNLWERLLWLSRKDVWFECCEDVYYEWAVRMME